MNEHDWQICDPRCRYAAFYRCTRCPAKKVYSWDPGWPGDTTYYNAQGDRCGAHACPVTPPPNYSAEQRVEELEMGA